MARQSFVLALALLLWSVAGRASLAALVLAYLAALALLQLPGLWQVVREPSVTQRLLLALLIAAPGVTFAWRQRAELAEVEGLHGLREHLADRLRLQRTPSIAPALVSADRPQSFFVYAPGTQQLQLRLGPRAKPLSGQALGEGVFRVDYDPRRDGPPSPADGELCAQIDADGHTTQRQLRSVTPLPHPRWLALSPNGERAAALSEETDELFVLGREGLLRRIAVDDGPSDCVFLDDAHIAVSHRYGRSLSIVELNGAQPTSHVAIGARQTRLALSPDRSRLAVALAGSEPSVALLDTQPLRERERVSVPAAADMLAFGTDAGTLLVSARKPASLWRMRAAATGAHYQLDATLPLSRAAVTMARSTDGTQLLLAVTDYDPQARPQLGNHFVQDQLLTVDVASLRVTSRQLTGRRSNRQSKPGDQDRGASPMGLSQHADGSWLIAFAGTDELWRMLPGASDPELYDLVDFPLHAPHGAVQLADGTLLVSSPSQGSFGLIAPGTHTPRIVRVAASDAKLLENNRPALERRVGERGFYEATRSGTSCQSCHMHGDSDEAAYNLGDHRLIPTLPVGGLLWSSPYLRDGSYAQLADLDDVAQTLYRGYLRSQGARGQAVQAYMEALPRRDAIDQPRDLARERRGLRAFWKARCPTCHAPPAFTNLGQLAMHSLFPDEATRLPKPELLDTPSLLSVSASAPYLNDGRARSLEALLTTHNRRNLHGDSHALSPSERSDLIFFLSSL